MRIKARRLTKEEIRRIKTKKDDELYLEYGDWAEEVLIESKLFKKRG